MSLFRYVEASDEHVHGKILETLDYSFQQSTTSIIKMKKRSQLKRDGATSTTGYISYYLNIRRQISGYTTGNPRFHMAPPLPEVAKPELKK